MSLSKELLSLIKKFKALAHLSQILLHLMWTNYGLPFYFIN